MIPRGSAWAGLRPWAALGLMAMAVAGGAVAIGSRNGPDPLPARVESERTDLLLITTLPIVFPENFSLEAAGSPALTALERRYRVKPINIADSASLEGHRLLLMAHPLAQPAEALVDLDAWVRAGGRLMLLADPRLDWPSERHLGDRFRPPPSFADTGLLRHWRLTLAEPDSEGIVERTVNGHDLRLSSPGILAGACSISGEGLVARCRIGRGKAAIVADADFLRTGDSESDNLQFLMSELDRLERD